MLLKVKNKKFYTVCHLACDWQYKAKQAKQSKEVFYEGAAYSLYALEII